MFNTPGRIGLGAQRVLRFDGSRTSEMRAENQNGREARLIRLLDWCLPENILVFKVIIVSALLVVGARTLAPFEVGKDQSAQLEAAQNLADGKGLTTTTDVQPVSFDIIVNSEPKYLTWWPPGLSLITSAFLSVGLSLSVSLKLIYGTVSLIGWFGWAIVASNFLLLPLRIGRRNVPIHLIIAALLPVFFTISWDGTDIFLWSAIPFLFLGLFKDGSKQASVYLVAGSGLLLGVVYAIRYASVFLALAAFLILVQVRFPDYKAALKRYGVFIASALVVMLPTYLYGKFYGANAPAITDRATSFITSTDSLHVITGALYKLPIISNLILGFPLVEQALIAINSRPLLIVSGLLFATLLLSLPVVLIKSCKTSGRSIQTDMALSLSFLPLSLVVFLFSINLMVNLGLFGVRRYYEPIAWCGVLLYYQLATARSTHWTTTLVSRGIVIAFVAYTCLYMPLLIFVPERNGHIVKTVLGFVPTNDVKYRGTSYEINYPSSKVYSNKESSRQKMQQLAAADPNALFFVEEYGSFIYDNFRGAVPIPGKTLRVFPRIEYWRKAFTSAPVKVFWVLNENTTLSFVDSSNQQVVFFDHVERTKILVSDFPAGHTFSAYQTASIGLPMRD